MKRSAMKRAGPRKCKACRQTFQPRNTMQVACGPACALQFAQQLRVREEARQLRIQRVETKAKLKSRSDWLHEAQAAVNRYVRLRDAAHPCVSCDRPATWKGQWHASHFRSVGAATSVRFHLWNIHKACSICNNHLSGNLIEYEPRLRERIGHARVDWLRTQNHRATYTVEYLSRLKRVMLKKANRLRKRLEESS